MEFDIDLIRERIFTARSKISADFGITSAATSAQGFCAQVVDALGQRSVADPLRSTVDNSALLKAACLAIWSSAADWIVVVKNQTTLASLFGNYDPDVASNAVLAEVVATLHTQYAKSIQAPAMLDWAVRLVREREYFATVVRPIADEMRKLGTHVGGITDPELMICLSIYFADPAARWAGEREIGAQLPPIVDRKFPGMGFAICAEFLRSLGWNGFKPDVHITRLFDHWASTCSLNLEEYEPRAQLLAELAGRGGSQHMRAHARYGLAGVELTPTGVSASEADNLIWLLGKYVETKGKVTDLPYLI